ncbi:MAG: aconitate hydratase AcnA [Anaerolineaceae bacterium]|nr:aconitate hydratase AcnA [Anaerolineaceae bacterium]
MQSSPIFFDTLKTEYGSYRFINLKTLAGGALDRLPFSMRILLEMAARHGAQGDQAALDAVPALIDWTAQTGSERAAIPVFPARVLLQDFTGVPVVVDLAAMRSALARMGGDPSQISPVIPVDLVVDHSLQVDFTHRPDALEKNVAKEFERNMERYQLLHWAQKAFDNFRVVPPSMGIIHQINLEYLASVVATSKDAEQPIAYPDSVFGTDSHTTMINGLGVLGWGVGGIEAVSAMLGKAVDIVMPDVIGFRLVGELQEGVSPMDVTLTIVEMLRKEGVVGKFIEFYGAGLPALSLPDRAMIANMTPENGGTMTFFPIDDVTLSYMRLSGRSAEQIALVEAYSRANGLFRDADTPEPEFTKKLELDLSKVEASLAGPTRPHDRVLMRKLKESFQHSLGAPKTERGFAVAAENRDTSAVVNLDGEPVEMKHGDVVIAAITSCTNTSNPTVLLGAGLLAKKAVERGLRVKPTVKTSLTPGSRVVTAYLKAAALIEPLSALGFDVVGYGCASCIGNSGPLKPEVVKAIEENGLVAASVSSANRNFEGRIHPNSRANYLASPPLVIAYALAGTVNIDLSSEALGTDQNGQPVYLRDLMPNSDEINALMSSVNAELFAENYADVFSGDANWQAIDSGSSALFPWNSESTYIQEPPFFDALQQKRPAAQQAVMDARVLALFGDSITTDHISPAGSIPAGGDAGQYLLSRGVERKDFNSFGSRRGNDRVMHRGTFGNIRIKNLMLHGEEGPLTLHQPDGAKLSIYQAAQQYAQEGVPLVVLAGKEYGSGSSRDWAAKGPMLLGVKAVIAESFERIHRSNLVGMGVLPLQFTDGMSWQKLGLTGNERLSLRGLDHLTPKQTIDVEVTHADGSVTCFEAVARIDTEAEIGYFHSGGILHDALYELLEG